MDPSVVGGFTIKKRNSFWSQINEEKFNLLYDLYEIVGEEKMESKLFLVVTMQLNITIN
jgi:hypothetical protein